MNNVPHFWSYGAMPQSAPTAPAPAGSRSVDVPAGGSFAGQVQQAMTAQESTAPPTPDAAPAFPPQRPPAREAATADPADSIPVPIALDVNGNDPYSNFVYPNDTNGGEVFGEDGFTFDDLIDIINPLQHIPIVSNIYRRMTGDEISAGSRMIAGAAFGGVPGFASALVNAVVEDATGKDLGETALAYLLGEDDAGTDPSMQLAAVEPAAGSAGDIAWNQTDRILTGEAQMVAWNASATAVTAAATAAATGMGSPIEQTAAMTRSAPAMPLGVRDNALGHPLAAVSRAPLAPGSVAGAQPQQSPVEAVLAARAAVPAAGRIEALGPERATRMDNLRDMRQNREGPAIPAKISSKLDAHLARLASESQADSQANSVAAVGAAAPPTRLVPNRNAPARAEQPPVSAAGAEPSFDETGAASASTSVQSGTAPGSIPGTGGPTVPQMVPQAMMQALDKYQSLLRQRTGAKVSADG